MENLDSESKNNGAIKYTWDKLSTDRPMELLERRRIMGKQAMISHVTLKKGCFVPSHCHENEQFACVLSGRIRFRLGTEDQKKNNEVILGAGEVLHLPSNILHDAEALEETLVLDIFSPPCEKTGIDIKR